MVSVNTLTLALMGVVLLATILIAAIGGGGALWLVPLVTALAIAANVAIMGRRGPRA